MLSFGIDCIAFSLMSACAGPKEGCCSGPRHLPVSGVQLPFRDGHVSRAWHACCVTAIRLLLLPQVGGPTDANGWPLLVEAVDLCFSGAGTLSFNRFALHTSHWSRPLLVQAVILAGATLLLLGF